MATGNGRRGLLQVMQDPQQALDLISKGGDWKGNHFLCKFCIHDGMSTCPTGRKAGCCASYVCKEMSYEAAESSVINYLLAPPQQPALNLK